MNYPTPWRPMHAKPNHSHSNTDSIDGILFPYRHESANINLTDADLVAAEVYQIVTVHEPGGLGVELTTKHTKPRKKRFLLVVLVV